MAIQRLFVQRQTSRSSFFDRALRSIGLSRVKASASGYPAYQGASLTRLNADWIGSLLSTDQEIRTSLKRLRARCRQLHNNNDYAQKFVALLKQNVIGPNGIQLEAQLSNDADELADQVNEEIERAWCVWCRTGNATCDRKLSFRDVLNLALESLIVDGEVFLRTVRGFPNNPFKFALQFVDPDQIDVLFERRRVRDERGLVMQNEVRMGVEVDEWGAPVGYWAFTAHPSEGGARREFIPAADMIHLFVFRRPNQSRGIPWMHTAMTRMNMLAGYEEAELVAARMEACKMGFLTSKTGEEYTGQRNPQSGAIEVTVEPGSLGQLPEGVDFKEWNPQHPNAAFGDFLKAMLRGAAAGLNLSYASLAGDLREVNFSSLRQGVLEEREMYRTLQALFVDHVCQPVYQKWVAQAILAKQLALPEAGLDEYADADNLRWQGRGWSWVDPLKDVQTAVVARGAGMTSLADVCAAQGKDWRDVIDQISIENEYAKKKGVTLNFDKPGANSIGKQAEATEDPNAPPVPVDEGENQGGN
jgi:lambda family phage portal protein